jgi:t-SNARE complex subunit (syntaxin)
LGFFSFLTVGAFFPRSRTNYSVSPEDIFKRDLLTSSQKHTLESVYAEVAETHRDVLELEVQFRELHEIFVDFAALVAQQDEMIDIISHNVGQSVAYVEKGRQKLAESRKIGNRSRKVMFCIIAVILIIAIVAVVVIAGIGTVLGVVLKSYTGA